MIRPFPREELYEATCDNHIKTSNTHPPPHRRTTLTAVRRVEHDRVTRPSMDPISKREVAADGNIGRTLEIFTLPRDWSA